MDRLSHLSADRLAELADGEPMPDEAAHLAQCASCAAERGAYQRVLTVAQIERERILPPLTAWETLAPKMRAEHLIDHPTTIPVRPRSREHNHPKLHRLDDASDSISK